MASDENAEWLFGGESGDEGQWDAHRRFISPTYNPIYRQGVVGPHHLNEADFAAFLKMCGSDEIGAATRFLDWVRSDRPQGGDYGDVALERISARASGFDAETALGIVSVFAHVMDEYYRLRPKREMFADVWEASESIIHTFRTAVPKFDFELVANHLSREGAAIAWLTAVIGRSELWSHGLAGDRPRDSAVWLLSEAALKEFVTVIAMRLSALKVDELLGVPRLGRVLFTLHDSPWVKGELDAILRRLAGPRVSDAGYLAFLEAMAGLVISSDRGAYLTISVQSLATLLGDDVFDRRWTRLLKKKLPADLTAKRAAVAKMIADGKRW